MEPTPSFFYRGGAELLVGNLVGARRPAELDDERVREIAQADVGLVDAASCHRSISGETTERSARPERYCASRRADPERSESIVGRTST
jgi:hypothetical protein